jgi:tetratricopeptide (TPR) repeat protein
VTGGERPPYVATSLGDVVSFVDEGRATWHMLRSSLGVESFGVNAWRATEAGQTLIGEHDEADAEASGHEELYLVHSGCATFTLDGETVPAPAGTVVFVRDRAVRRSAVADEADTVVVVVGGAPGQAFTVSRWERVGEALRFWTTQEWDRAAEVLTRQHEEDPDDAPILYNLACAESRGGRADDALAHLARAVELRPSFAESAQTDPDLEAIRGDDRFPRAE